MIEELARLPPSGIALTLGVWVVARALYLRTGFALLNPVAVTIAGVIAVLVAAEVPYADYAVGGDYLLFLLGPAVVALAVPLYEQRREVLSRLGAILAGIVAGALSSIVSAVGIAVALGGSDAVARSMAPKSVTTPIAIALSEGIDGIPALTACIVVTTGVLGALFGPELCRRLGVTGEAATGLAMGTAAHGIGTARMIERGALGGAVSGLAIGLNGLATSALLPAIWPWLERTLLR